jgi:LytS/YehU family sensor histidine kinase
LRNDQNTKKFVRAEMNFEYQKKEAVLLEKNKRQQQLILFSIVGALLLLGLIFVIYNRMQVKRRLTLQKEVAEYEQKALHLQMNPHFVFNCLGSISSFIVQNGIDSAIKYLSKFSKLMRLTLEYSKGSLIPIDKEIEGLQNYLELEQLRFNKKFDFSIQSSPEIEDDMALPPLLIQPFVENAILHGLVPKEGKGKINIRFEVQNNQLICTIVDDGIGFLKSKALKENSVTAHQSMALEITKKRLEMMEATTSQSASVSIEEITNNNNEVEGTKVIISLPIQYTSDTKIRI